MNWLERNFGVKNREELEEYLKPGMELESEDFVVRTVIDKNEIVDFVRFEDNDHAIVRCKNGGEWKVALESVKKFPNRLKCGDVVIINERGKRQLLGRMFYDSKSITHIQSGREGPHNNRYAFLPDHGVKPFDRSVWWLEYLERETDFWERILKVYKRADRLSNENLTWEGIGRYFTPNPNKIDRIAKEQFCLNLSGNGCKICRFYVGKDDVHCAFNAIRDSLRSKRKQDKLKARKWIKYILDMANEKLKRMTFTEKITVEELAKKIWDTAKETKRYNDDKDDESTGQEKSTNYRCINQVYYGNLTERIVDDFSKVQFDHENTETDKIEQRKYCIGSPLVGFHELDNGLSFFGATACGDWEKEVFFIIWWDGKELRGYVPEEGNGWNPNTHAAIGNNEHEDKAYLDGIPDENKIPGFDEVRLNYDKMKVDILRNIKYEGE